MLSYDLPILWPRRFAEMTKRFFAARRTERDLFLDRTGVRYRILPPKQAPGRAPLTQIPYFFDSYLYDFGSRVSPRVSIVSEVRAVAAEDRQLEALFQNDWDAHAVA